MKNLTIDGKEYLIDSEVNDLVKALKIKFLEATLKYYDILLISPYYVYDSLSKSNKGFNDWKKQLNRIRDNYKKRLDKIKE